MKARQKVRRKAAPKDRVFGCDLVEHLQLSGHDVPQVLKSCTEFVEKHGIVDGIYRLSGVSSNIQKLRLEFDTDRCPDLNKDLYLQDIHCVSSLCKAYFRELPNPLLTYQLYDKFADAVAIQMEEGRLVKIKEVLKELPPQHYRTLEFLMRHLVRIASFSAKTNMHVRNLAIVWAPNLLRSKDIEASGFNGTAAFMEVRIQSIVVEFILTHVEQLFGDAPLCAGSRESLRKSLLLMGSPTVLFDDKYCFPCNVPTMLNQGDGPPQMRPYHTIIDLNEHKRKGSLKAKKWRSIFNLGRSSNDSKRKLNKPEEKEVDKMRLRPAKSMDSLSSMPCVSDDVPQLGRKRPQKQLVQARGESFNSRSSQDNSSLELEKIKAEEGMGESEGEATAKSEPTTPQASRSSHVGVAPQGRSPQSARSRAEKCVGVHISGPISVTVPFHITSNLTLSRLTRGLECPALSHCTLEKEAPETSLATEGTPSLKENEDKPKPVSESSMDKEDPTEPDTIAERSLDLENQLSLEVQDSFSFLDSQDAWLGDSLDSDQPWKNLHMAPDFAARETDDFPAMDDDMGSGFMNEMMRESWQRETFSAAPSLNYLSIEECMNEQSDEEDDQYYLATGCLDKEEHSKEVDSEEVYLSAYDDLSPLANELKHYQHLNDTPGAPLIGNLTEDQPFSLVGEFSSGDPAVSEAEVEPLPGSPPANDPQFVNSHLDSEQTSLVEEDNGVPLSSRSDSHELETSERNGTKATKVKPSFPLPLQAEDANAGDEDDLLLETGCLLQAECPPRVSEENQEETVAPDYVTQATQPSLEDEQQLQAQVASETEQVQWPPCMPSLEADGPAPEMAGTTDEHVDCEFLLQDAQQLLSREISRLNREISQASSSLEDQRLAGTHTQRSLSLGSTSEMPYSEVHPLSAPVLSLSPEEPPWSHTSFPYAPLSDSWTESSSLLRMASFRKSCPETLLLKKPYYAPPEGASAAPEHNVQPDGSVSMKKTSSTVRVQQVKSFPVIPPKPQFAKTPPFLVPISPTKEASILWPDPPISDHDGNEVKNGSNEDTTHKPPRPISLTTDSSESIENLPASSETPTSPSNRLSGSGTLQKQRNSMPVCLEKYDREDESRGDMLQNLQCSSPVSLDKCSHWAKKDELSGDDLQQMKCSLPENLDTCGGNSKREDGKGELPPRYQLAHGKGSGAAPQKQRWTNWRNGGSMSFDEAVALAKERHVAQAPVRRMQTYCCGDVEGLHSLSRAEKPPPVPKPALRPLGQRPLRPLSCTGTAASPEALLSGKPLLAQASSDIISEGQLSPNQEAPCVPRDLLSRGRLSLLKMGRRLSMSEEIPGAAR
ncbi:PREDICTED: rho GTPase-activating protein 30 [Gekko japonicus]|uniref:Rho GTPase-activating protein 30 n=1 Tax=Gekko japonicus TaxID=146911 RepID=A0ABM1JQT2_GEKJA|nr:PREDICTED: rho GTPase-activating protein 30 [Gekko japonicus]